MVENGESKKSWLRVCRVVDVPLHEVSGMFLAAAEPVACL
jgi:hypothetical protein